jgi:mRNA interferase RelE/StbE
MTYKIIYLSEVVKKHIPSLSSSVKLVIRDAIERKLSTDPLTYGKPLRYSLKGHRRIRVGNYRVISIA